MASLFYLDSCALPIIVIFEWWLYCVGGQQLLSKAKFLTTKDKVFLVAGSCSWNDLLEEDKAEPKSDFKHAFLEKSCCNNQRQRITSDRNNSRNPAKPGDNEEQNSLRNLRPWPWWFKTLACLSNAVWWMSWKSLREIEKIVSNLKKARTENKSHSNLFISIFYLNLGKEAFNRSATPLSDTIDSKHSFPANLAFQKNMIHLSRLCLVLLEGEPFCFLNW